jgi:F0F1-type ATP synthase assembly protein I
MDTDPGRIKFPRAIYGLEYDFRATIIGRKASKYQAKAAHFTTAISPFLGHKNDLSTPHTLHKTKQSLLIQSPGKEKSSFIMFLEMISGIFVSLLLPTLADLALGAGDVKESAPGVICHVQIEKLLDKNTRRSRERKESGMAIWSERVEGRIVGVNIAGCFCSIS